MRQWEYKIVTAERLDEDHINTLGRDGWELLPTGGDALYFKREYFPPGQNTIA